MTVITFFQKLPEKIWVVHIKLVKRPSRDCARWSILKDIKWQ